MTYALTEHGETVERVLAHYTHRKADPRQIAEEVVRALQFPRLDDEELGDTDFFHQRWINKFYPPAADDPTQPVEDTT